MIIVIGFLSFKKMRYALSEIRIAFMHVRNAEYDIIVRICFDVF